MFKRRLFVAVFILTLGSAFNKTIVFAQEPVESTLSNLQAAYDGESNAHAKYLVFAAKADAEGFGQVASLFRAAARAEEIHANNHAKVIRALGIEPKTNLAKVEAKSTAENLKAAIEGESYERDTMYPKFIAKARLDGNRDAVRSFSFAVFAEAGHAKFYQQALENLDQWKQGKKTFYVCSVCGNTVDKLDFAKCPKCMTPTEQFEQVQ